MFLFTLIVFLLVLGVYLMLVVGGMWDLGSYLRPGHVVHRLLAVLSVPFRRGTADEREVDEMARRLRGGPGSWPRPS
ncbi:MAG: hypothetical protein FJX78_06375 [Armatimonadetes bacterium]|nr:hypothetical protein [Armatimonadota bacterium]